MPPAIIGNIIILVVLLIAGVPVFFCFAASLVFLVVVGGFDPSFLLPYGFYKMSSIVLLALPLFIVAGNLMGEGGISKPLIDLAESLIGRVKGKLGMVGVVSCALFGAMSGSGAATLAAIGGIMLPRMKERGYPPGHSAALMGCASILGLLIPPSLLQVLYGWVTQTSIAGCFLSTAIPGVILTIWLCFLNWLMLRREPGLELSPKQSFKERVKTIGVNTRHAAFGLFAPFIILGGIYGGIFTPTEAAAVAAVYAIPVGFFVYHALSREKLIDCIIKSASQTGMIMVMLYCMMMLSRIYIMENVPQHIATFLTGISENKYVILLMVNVFLLIIGMLMDDASGVLLCAPLLFPVVTSIGVHPFHFAAIIGTNLGMGNITPPCAPLLYFAQSLGEVGFDKVIKPAIILIVFGFFPVVLLTTYLPELSLFLPRLAGFVH